MRPLGRIPFQVQVSVKHSLPLPLPPNRTAVWVAVSYAMGAARAEGLAAGFCWVQVLVTPFHVQVSPRTPAELLTPKRTTVLAALYYVIATAWRGDGETGGDC